MDLQNPTRNDVRQILRASEGIPSWVSEARKIGGQLVPAKMGHPITNHLHSVRATKNKTKFVSMDDMVEAVWQVLNSPPGQAALRTLQPNMRPPEIVWELDRLLPVECEVPDPQGRPTTHQVTFTSDDQLRAGHRRTKCLVVIEGRERAGVTHLQVVTAYPAIDKLQIQHLLQSTRQNDSYRRR